MPRATVEHDDSPSISTARLSARDRAGLAALRLVNGASRRSGRGQGTVAGGRVALRVAPRLLERLACGLQLALVSGTNGKTTTTACLAAAMSTQGLVATNDTGSNMLPGHVAALGSSTARIAVLEVDEVWLPLAIPVERPDAVVVLNLSRDQLDRTSEVRHVARSWQAALASLEGTCVANADDPLVVSAAVHAPNVAWFAGGLEFREDASACPRCMARIHFDGDGGWRCECGLARPDPDAFQRDGTAVVDGTQVPFTMALPGAFNEGNGLAALLAAVRLGVDAAAAAAAICSVTDVAGRFSELDVDGSRARLLLAKNPAGWGALLGLLADDDAPVVVAINARVADGLDPSWLYDVEVERLAGRRVVATGERWRDLSTRLFYAGVEHTTETDPRRAIVLAGTAGRRVDVIANYTAFAALHGAR
jgi:UDP-N-acetylmuramyl tripeptide synthase